MFSHHKLVRLVCLLMFYFKVTDMVLLCPKKIQQVTFALVVGFSTSTIGLAADLSRFNGIDLVQNKDVVASQMKGRNYVVQLDQNGKITKLLDAGANGAGSEPLRLADSASDYRNTSDLVEMPVNYQGQKAIDFLGKKIVQIARNNGLTTEKLTEMLLQDETLRVDSTGQLLYVDNPADPQAERPVGTALSPVIAKGVTASNSATVPIASPAALANAFLLHSKRGASKTIYLDFDGYSAQGTAWSGSTITAPAYDLTGNPGVFDDTERSNIISIWNRIAEDFIPFDVDITTEAPTTDALLRTSTVDTSYGTRVVITKSVINCSCGGVAYVGVVNLINNNRYQPAWVFQDSLGNSEKNIAEAASHEAGHTLGLLHDGQKPSTSYYLGHGSGETGWASIMGAGYYKNVTQWNSGTYPNANNQQDDIATLASYGITASADDYGNMIATATSLTNVSTTGTPIIKTYGVIGTSSDVDMFVINASAGVINLTASPAAVGPNLDIKLTLYNGSGTVVASSAPEATLSATINQSVAAGTYYLAVANSVHAATATDPGYPVYGSLGQYQITGSYVSGNSTNLAPVASISTKVVSGIAPLAINFSAAGSVGNGSIISYSWDFGDASTATGVSVSHTFTKVGTYTVKLVVTNQYQLTSTKTLQISVTAPPAIVMPTLWESRVGMMVSISSKIRATVSIAVIGSNGKPVPNAKVEGVFSGSVATAVVGVTDSNGNIVQTATNATPSGRSVTYTLKNIAATGYVYDPSKNARSVITLSW